MGDMQQIARNLFADLRELESEGVKIILTHRFPDDGAWGGDQRPAEPGRAAEVAPNFRES